MWNNPSLPFLPGYSFTDPTKTDFGINQSLVYTPQGLMKKTTFPDTTHEALKLLDAENSLHDDSIIEMTYGPRRSFLQNSPVPDVITFDKQVLRFYGYYREDINDSWSEEFRIHHVKIYYYLEDDTFEVHEPKVANSGLPQGVILKRTKIYRPDGKGIYLWKDLNIGMDLIIFGKRFRITDCDQWTKEYLESTGITLNPKVDEIPDDPFTQKMKALSIKPVEHGIRLEDEKLFKFLNHDRKVLRFYGVWDDSMIDPNEKRKVVIQYYLMDDTLEVLEKYSKNCGRDEIPSLIRRQKIPKNLFSVPKDFPTTYFEYTDKEVKEWFMPIDFEVGKTILIYNRPFFLYDCDEFTRKYYQHKYGKEMAAPIDVEEKPKPPVPKPVPLHTGLGTWEDSLQSCLSTIPKVPKKDVLKMLYNDDKVLRFSAHMITPWPLDQSRKFVISFFPADDTVLIFERHIMNSGFASGTFLKRCKLPKNDVSTGVRPVYYTAEDFYIGARIKASGRIFEIDDADRFVLKFMEENTDLYTDEIIGIHRLKTAEGKFSHEPLHSTKEALQNEMRQHILKIFGENFELPRIDFGEGEQHREVVREKLKSVNIPIPRELLNKAMDICTVDNGKIDVEAFQKIILFSLGQPQ